jgi:hypothetical protein
MKKSKGIMLNMINQFVNKMDKKQFYLKGKNIMKKSYIILGVILLIGLFVFIPVGAACPEGYTDECCKAYDERMEAKKVLDSCLAACKPFYEGECKLIGGEKVCSIIGENISSSDIFCRDICYEKYGQDYKDADDRFTRLCVTDSDGDGVPDGDDQCLGTPAGVAVDDKGCPIGMQLSVSTDKPSYTPPEKDKTKDVAIVVTVKTDGHPVPGAAVSGHVELPDGSKAFLSFEDTGGGEYKASYTLEKSFPEGTYTIKVNAKKGTSEGTGEESFDLCILRLRGFVTDGHTDSFGKEHRLVGVPVTLSWDDVLLPTVYTDAVGCYEIKDQSIVLGTEKEGLLSVALIDKDKTIKIVDKSYSDLVPHPDGCVYATTNVFKLVTADDLYRDIDLSKTNDFGVPMTPNGKAHLDDNAAIYYHTYQALEYARHLGIKLDLDLPLEIGTYAISGDDAYWTGPPLTKKPTHIALGTSTSEYRQWDRPRNREWHEFGHHVMADAYGNQLPNRGEVNHAGYKNAHTTDSWREGWAEFYACLVAFHQGSINWRVYPVGGNLDVNIKFWDHTRNLWWEELAIAGILVDIRDGKELIQPYLFSMGPEFEAELNKGIISDKLKNIFKANGFPLSASATVITEKKPVKRWRITDEEKFIIRNKSGSLHGYEDRWELADDDEIELSDKQIWGVLKQKRSTAGEGNGYIFDVKDVYDAFIQLLS